MKKTLHILQKLPDTDLFFPLLSYIRGKKLEEKKISLEKNLIVLVKQVPLVLSYCLMSLLYYFICFVMELECQNIHYIYIYAVKLCLGYQDRF